MSTGELSFVEDLSASYNSILYVANPLSNYFMKCLNVLFLSTLG